MKNKIYLNINVNGKTNESKFDKYQEQISK